MSEGKRQSPYQRYGKTPFKYQHKDCSHRRSHYEAVPEWRGMVCDVCNIITDGPFDRDRVRPREAA